MSTTMTDTTQPQITAEALIARHLNGLRYGEVVIHVHDGRIVQIERTDRVRPANQPAVA